MFSKNKKSNVSAVETSKNAASKSSYLPKLPKSSRIPYLSRISDRCKKKASSAKPSGYDGNYVSMPRSFSFSNYKSNDSMESRSLLKPCSNFDSDLSPESYARQANQVETQSPFFGSLPRLKNTEIFFEPYRDPQNPRFRSETPLSSSSICSEIAAFFGEARQQNFEDDVEKPTRTPIQADYPISADFPNNYEPNMLYRSLSNSETPLITQCDGNKVRSRRRESSLGNGNVENPPRRISTTAQVNNRSYPNVFDCSQFTPIQNAPYVEHHPNPCVSAPAGHRTAIVGPRTVGRGYDEEMPVFSGEVVTRMSRSLYENGCEAAVSHASTPKRRDHSSGPQRRNVQGLEGSGLFQLCGSPSSRECSAFPDVEMYSSGSRSIRPSDLRLTPSSSGVSTENAVMSINSPSAQNAHLSSSNGMNYQLTGSAEKRSMIANTSLKKVIVAPQPHYRSQNANLYDDSCRGDGSFSDVQLVHRRRSSGATNAGLLQHYDKRCNYPRDVSIAVVPIGSRPVSYDERSLRSRSGNDVRVTALEKRVRELEATISGGVAQLPNPPSSTSTSFIVPVNGESPQVIVSSVSSATTQQLMAQEIADKEVEIERLQSQLRQCYSRMELRKVHFDEEVSKFRKESQEAKSQLEKVKSRLNQLENECSEYRERATFVEAARNSAIASSLDKISAQEIELSQLRAEVEHLSGLSHELENVKSELRESKSVNKELQQEVETKQRKIHDLEDSIFAMKMEASCKISSGSATPCDEARSLIDVEMPKYFAGLKDLRELTPKCSHKRTLSNSANTSRLKKSQSSQQLSLSNEKVNLPPTFSVVIRKQIASILECRLLAKCLKDTASKAMSGDLPSVNRLLGCRSESMSESEIEGLPTDSTPMPLLVAERHIKKVAEDLQRVENDLDFLREKFVEYYEKKVVVDLQENDMCKIQ